MPADIGDRSDIIEECYEFLLAYAGQGLPDEQGSQAGSHVRDYLKRAAEALRGLANAFEKAVAEQELEPSEKYHAFSAVLDRDARNSLAAIDLVLAQPSISSQLIDNLNASIHIRAVLTDLFLISEILEKQTRPEGPLVTNQPE